MSLKMELKPPDVVNENAKSPHVAGNDVKPPDINGDDVLNIEIDPAILLSYELNDKLNLIDILELSDEIHKNNSNLDDSDSVPSKNRVLVEVKCISESSIKQEILTDEHKIEDHSEKNEQKKDINGNEESSFENLDHLFDNLELISDSDNEDVDCLELKERGGSERRTSRAKKNREKLNILNKIDKSQLNHQSLMHLSGSSQINIYEPCAADQCIIYPNLTSINIESENIPTLPSNDYLYGDARAKVIGSPESGYESSSAQSGTCSPPLSQLPMPYSLDFIPETVDEQKILEFLAENTTDCALPDQSEILKYLKDIPDELNESTDVAESLDFFHKNVETPIKLGYKLKDKAKGRLRKFLSDDEFYASEAKIYKRINEDLANKKTIHVIYVEDETDKASENRTNLHYAVLDSRIEDIYCLVEIHKQYNKPFTDINIRDKYGKTALDYAIQNQMTLVVDYLKENTACQSVNI